MTEFFRHFRPLEVNQRGEIISQRNGGISFLCKQHGDSSIDFWIYICPFTAGFSSRAAVTRLRKSAEHAAPWGRLGHPTDEPLILQLVRGISEKRDLPTDVTRILREIVEINLGVEDKHEQLKEQNAIQLYAKD